MTIALFYSLHSPDYSNANVQAGFGTQSCTTAEKGTEYDIGAKLHRFHNLYIIT